MSNSEGYKALMALIGEIEPVVVTTCPEGHPLVKKSCKKCDKMRQLRKKYGRNIFY